MITAATPITIGRRVMRNRITMAPTVKFCAGEDGMVTEAFVRHYEARAAHGAGLIVLEATCVTPEARLHPTQLGLWRDEQIEGHRRIAEAVHRHGALVIPQLHHGGLGTHPACGPYTSPTAMPWRGSEAVALSPAEIRRVIRLFAEAALRAKQAGYDGVQLHGCHQYLINAFASDINKRTDAYGGSLENKARLGCDIIRAIRQACGEDFIISVRVSGADPTIEEAAVIAGYYVDAGCDYLQVSCGFAPFDEVPDSLPCNRIAGLGVLLRQRLKGRVPVSVVNGLRTPEKVRVLFEQDLTDTVDLGCGLLADPAFTEAIL